MSGFTVRGVGAFLALLLLGFAVALLYPRLQARRADALRQPALVLQGEPDCDPGRATCVASRPGMTVSLSLKGPVRPLTPFAVTVRLEGTETIGTPRVAVTFSMVGMYMGSNRFDLRQQTPTTWQGRAMLPVCGSGRTDWRIAVEVGGEPISVAEFFTVLER
jgi:hypothetical protein